MTNTPSIYARQHKQARTVAAGIARSLSTHLGTTWTLSEEFDADGIGMATVIATGPDERRLTISTSATGRALTLEYACEISRGGVPKVWHTTNMERPAVNWVLAQLGIRKETAA